MNQFSLIYCMVNILELFEIWKPDVDSMCDAYNISNKSEAETTLNV